MMCQRLPAYLCLLAACFCFGIPVLGQVSSGTGSTSNADLQAQIDRLTLEGKISALQAQIQKDKTVPSNVTQVQPLAGKTTGDDKSFMEAYALAYNAMRDTAKKIYERIVLANGIEWKDKKITLVVFDGTSFNTISQYRSFRPQLSFLRASLCQALQSPPPEEVNRSFIEGGITTATNLVGSVATLLAMFRTDVNIAGTDVTIDDATLVGEVANLFTSQSSNTDKDQKPAAQTPRVNRLVNGLTVIVPGQYLPPDPVSSADLQEALTGNKWKCSYPEYTEPEGLILAFASLTYIRGQAGTRFADNSRKLQLVTDDNAKIEAAKQTEGDLNQLKKDVGTLTSPEEKQLTEAKNAQVNARSDIREKVGDLSEINRLKRVTPAIKGLMDQFDALAKILATPDDNGLTPLARFNMSEKLAQLLAAPHTYVLVLKVLKVAGGNLTKTNLFYGSHLYHTGGATASFMLLDANNSNVVSSGSFTSITNYMREKTFKKKFGTN